MRRWREIVFFLAGSIGVSCTGGGAKAKGDAGPFGGRVDSGGGSGFGYDDDGGFGFPEDDSGVTPPTSGPKVFVSSAAYDGNLVSVANALGGAPSNALEAGDFLCKHAAEAQKLGGEYKALLTITSASPTARIEGVGGPWVDLKGQVVFADKAALDVAASVPIRITEKGEDLGGGPLTEYAWVGGDLSSTENCVGFSNASGTKQGLAVIVGETLAWLQTKPLNCNTQVRLYCFDQTGAMSTPLGDL